MRGNKAAVRFRSPVKIRGRGQARSFCAVLSAGVAVVLAAAILPSAAATMPDEETDLTIETFHQELRELYLSLDDYCDELREVKIIHPVGGEPQRTESRGLSLCFASPNQLALEAFRGDHIVAGVYSDGERLFQVNHAFSQYRESGTADSIQKMFSQFDAHALPAAEAANHLVLRVMWDAIYDASQVEMRILQDTKDEDGHRRVSGTMHEAEDVWLPEWKADFEKPTVTFAYVLDRDSGLIRRFESKIRNHDPESSWTYVENATIIDVKSVNKGAENRSFEYEPPDDLVQKEELDPG